MNTFSQKEKNSIVMFAELDDIWDFRYIRVMIKIREKQNGIRNKKYIYIC